MSRRYLIAGNWKMNKTVAEGVALARDLRAQAVAAGAAELVVCPPFTTLAAVAAELRGSSIAVGAQNVHWEASGAFTGEVSGAMLHDIPVTHVIVGHSERRQFFGETDGTVNRRLKAALGAGLVPIVCVGETRAEREAGQTAAVVRRQVEAGLAGLTAETMATVVIAYEPVWAIGTGLNATPDQAQEVHAQIRALLAAGFGAGVAAATRILYGGSVKGDNATALLGQPDIDGALVGGASLKAADFLAIAAAANT
jgi:triosephosphate isomerase